jgi:hypothetical protein
MAGWGDTLAMRWLCWVLAMTGLVVANPARAQRSQASMGSVSGTVTCGDTELPARFAEVTLVRRPSAAEVAKLFAPEGESDGRSGSKGAEVIDALEERSGADGSYSISQVPPGDYWAVAKLEGYLLPVSFANDETEARDLERLMAGAQQIHITANSTTSANVRLERGGSVVGQVVFEDRSPAVGWDVWLVPLGAKEVTPVASPYPGISEILDPLSHLGDNETDDEGNFRMAGIPPGKYLVATRLEVESGRRITEQGYSTGNSSQQILMFAPGVMGRERATPIEIRADETVGDINVNLDLSHLRSIRGRVLSAKDHQPADGTVVSAYNGDYGQRARAAADGSYHLDFLPPGTYTLSVIPGFPDAKDRTRHYEHPHQTVVMGDEDVMLEDILMNEIKPKAKD